MQHTVTLFDRLRIERVVWALDQRLYDLPRRTRIETRREVRRNLLTGARDVGTTQALRNLGGSAELAQEYLSAAFGSRPRHHWMAAGLFFVTVPFLALSFFADAANAFASGITAAEPAATGTYTWGGISHLQSTVTYTFSRRPRNLGRRQLHAPLLHPLDRRDNPRRTTLASAPGLAQAPRTRLRNAAR